MRVLSVIKTRAGYKVQKLVIEDRSDAVKVTKQLQKEGVQCFVGKRLLDGYPIYTQ